VVAGKQYNKNSFQQWLWGKHYRKDWVTPVTVRTIDLDTVNGGLTAYEKGGGRQSKTLRLRNAAGKEYVLRSNDKSFGKALPEKYRGTFIEDIIDGQVSIAQPYSAITIPGMAAAAGIYHTNPQIVYVPSQKALGEFDKDFGNDLYLFEQRPDENWEEAPNFGNSKKIVSTEKMLENIFSDNDNRADQAGFVRARLFDMFIGDWGRHEDQWRWATIEEGDKKFYKPIPRDRDQVYTKFDGALLSIGISAAGAGHLETFGKDIKNVATYNYPARNLDRQIANEPSKEQWITIAKDLQQSLTDKVIEESVKQLPPEVFPLSGNEIIRKLKSRRDKLVEFATDYYSFLAREVDIVGTHDSEFFEIRSVSPAETEISIYDINKEGQPKKNPFYSRKFLSTETNEIRIYGLTGNDQYAINTGAANRIKIRIIGGPGKDVYISTGAVRVDIYDNGDNDFTKLDGPKKHLSENPFIHLYNYTGFNYDKKGPGPVLSYNSEDHIYVGLKYEIEKQQWRKQPFGYQHELAARYSISEGAFSFGYNSIFTSLIGNWDLHLNADYDLVRWTNFFGIGNETLRGKENRDFNRVRSKEFYAGAGIERTFAGYHYAGLTAFYQMVEILDDPGRFITKQTPSFISFDQKKFGGAKLNYRYQKLDNGAVPTRGIKFVADLSFMQNLEQSDSTVANFSSAINIYIPLSKSFVFALKTGGAALTGKPEFYQLNKLTGSKTLRGYRKYRFYGESMFYNQAELQFIRNVKTYLFSGKAGLIALYDIGRVWQPGESSGTWHYGYGGGIMLAPFNKVSVAVFYAISRDERDFSIRILKDL
ncbi:MAG: BamA/TamA family outer membrane protein, partial [Ferruginibacter sp.]|nr:BamA/TamA family outer membrane protein [Chitinophagaceae bacterium]